MTVELVLGYVVVQHMTIKKKVYAIHNEKHCDFDTLRLRRMENVYGNEVINVVLG